MKNVYFIGIGGIGMSAVARYYKARGLSVAGYDLTPSPLTRELEAEGIAIHYEDDPEAIPLSFRNPAETLAIYTPAIPSEMQELCYFVKHNFRLLKRAEVLGLITHEHKALCVAGTHGKTTTSTMLAHLLRQSPVDCNAFLGGISNNYDNNLLLSDKSPYVVVEADEFDRSFHRLAPFMSVVTAADPDHLDIYGTPAAYREAFEHFTSLIRSEGALVIKKGIPVTPRCADNVRLFSYAAEDSGADFYSDNIRVGEGKLLFDWHAPGGVVLRNVSCGVPLVINVENATAAMAIAHLCGVTLDDLAKGIASFRGTRRRFDFVLQTPRVTLIDDYAHHPVELSASVGSVRRLYAGKRVLGIFQPHLYSRTADFYREFAESLALLDEVILMDIYPARECPIPGVSSRMIADLLGEKVSVVSKQELLPLLKRREVPEVVLMLGAGDIDRLVQPVTEYLRTLC